MESWNRLRRAGSEYGRLPFKAGAYAETVERLWLRRFDGPSKPPLFILGLPRSGTTLIYQYIVHRLRVSYFTNGVGRCPKAPCLTTLMQRKIYGDYSSDFTSHYGKVKGPVAPREAGGVWARYFGLEDYVDRGTVSEDKIRRLRRTIACVERIFGGAPFVNKNVKHLLRIGALRDVFPNCHFLIVERDRTEVALSLLRGRRQLSPDATEWLSARPPDYDALKRLPLVEQVTGQLASLHAKMEADIAKLGAGNVTRMHYDTFCDEPEHVIELLSPPFSELQRRNPARDRFERSRSLPHGQQEEALVRLLQDAAE